MDNEKQFIVIKKIAKHGKQAVVIVPKVLEKRLKPGTIARFTIDILQEAENE